MSNDFEDGLKEIGKGVLIGIPFFIFIIPFLPGALVMWFIDNDVVEFLGILIVTLAQLALYAYLIGKKLKKHNEQKKQENIF